VNAIKPNAMKDVKILGAKKTSGVDNKTIDLK